MKRKIVILFIIGLVLFSSIVYAQTYQLDGLELEFEYSPSSSSQVGGITFNNDGTKIYVATLVSSEIQSHELSEPYDLSTAESHNAISVNSFVSDVKFNDEGTIMYTSHLNDNILEYELSEPFDISTATQTDSHNLGDDPHGMTFNNDGSKFYVVDDTGDDIDQYELSTPYDLSTASLEVTAIGDNNPGSMTWGEDGNKFFLADKEGDIITEYSVNESYNVSDITIEDTWNIGDDPHGLLWDNSGERFYVGLDGAGSISQYGYPFSPNVNIEAKEFMKPDSTQSYTVEITNEDESLSDVSDNENTTVTSSNTSIITVNENSNTLNSQELTGTVTINVSYTHTNGIANDSISIFVGDRNIGNIEQLPPSQWIPAVLGIDEDGLLGGVGSEFQWLLFSIIIMTAVTVITRNAYVGIGTEAIVILLLWIMNFVGVEILISVILFTLFIGFTAYDSETAGIEINNFR